jgi:hypothetical protein
MSRRSVRPIVLASVFASGLFFPWTAGAGAVKSETAEDVQLDVMVASARTKADHQKIAQMYGEEAKAEAAKAKALRDQAEAYRVHKQDFYSRNILDLIEHTDALARNYQEASDRHKYLAEIHSQMADEMKK